jgi:hypothetical protein
MISKTFGYMIASDFHQVGKSERGAKIAAGKAGADRVAYRVSGGIHDGLVYVISTKDKGKWSCRCGGI